MKRIASAFLLALIPNASPPAAATKDHGGGFYDHGVAAPVSTNRGIVAVADGEGRNAVLIWLYDHRGGYALLMVDAETGRSEEFPTPHPNKYGPFASLLSSAGKYYTHFGDHFTEFDPAKRAFTFVGKTKPGFAMSLTEADDGTIWAATHPNAGVVSFNPKTRTLRDYGYVNRENWRQFPRRIAVDDAGWVYVGIGMAAAQIVALEPASGKTIALLSPAERKHGLPTLQRDINGKVYALPPSAAKDGWLELYKGEVRKLGAAPSLRGKPVIAGTQGLCHRKFPDGKQLVRCNTVERELVISDPGTKQTKTVRFDYTTEGALIMSLATAPGGTVCGGTSFPMRFFAFNPKTDQWVNRAAYGQFNTLARQGDRLFIGGYGDGFLLEWDPARPWVDTEKGNPGCNPLWLTECELTVFRPHKLLAYPDGNTLVLAGTPGYGLTGGGLLFWDRATRQRVLLEHTAILPQHSTMSLAALPGGKLLGGTTTEGGSGGERKAKEAELYVMDIATKKVEWHAAVLPGVQSYTDLCAGPQRLVFGFADHSRFFVFDTATRKVIHQRDTEAEFGLVVSQQGPRVFVTDNKGGFYILFQKCIGRLNPKTFQITLLARPPVPIGGGGDYLDGRIYFYHGSRVYSYRLSAAGK
ncbi:MAG: hypothetical protein N3B01_11510 [Verrucomicrobiae bacterium]|nr:hypothetical protein [Verrucomicrobiae bacterium]